MNEKIYPPLALPAIFIYGLIVLLLTLTFPFIAIAAFHAAGLPGWAGLSILWTSLIGSFINIPIKKIRTGRMVEELHVVTFLGIPYYVPRLAEEKMVIAVNVGGALIPSALATFMLFRLALIGGAISILKAFTALIIVSAVTYRSSKIVEGVGIAVHPLIPSLTAVITSLILTWSYAPSVGYISGTFGTLIGADLMNLGKLKEIRAPIVSIGGAGTFDGIFLTGILVLIIVAFIK